MIDLSNHSLNDSIPSSIKDDAEVQNIIKALDVELKKINTQTSLVLFMPRLDELSEAMVDELAWQFHVDLYDADLTIEKKRNLVRDSIAWHRKKGTKAAVQEMTAGVYSGGKVLEWFEYGGDPYHFKISVKDAPMNYDEITRIGRLVKESKNTRSWLDAITFESDVECKYFCGFAGDVFKTIDIMPQAVGDENIENTLHFGTGADLYKVFSIGPAAVEDTAISAVMKSGQNISDFKKVNIGPQAVEPTILNYEVAGTIGAETYKKINIK